MAINWNVPVFFILGFLISELDISVATHHEEKSESISMLHKNEGINIVKQRSNLRISFITKEKKTGNISLYNLAGRQVVKPISILIPEGESAYNFRLSENNLSRGTYIIKVRMGIHNKILRLALF